MVSAKNNKICAARMIADFKTLGTGILIGGAVGALITKILLGDSQDDLLEVVLKRAAVDESGTESRHVPGCSQEIVSEQFVRNEQFFGADAQLQVASGRVVVVGVGGVGSHCAVTLARSGVRHIRLIDFDRVTVSSLNRHASAVRAEVGLPKVDSLKRFIGEFSPECEVDAVEALFNYDSALEQISAYKPDWVIDAIDNIHTKADLLAYCHQKGIRVISACGSAAKCDPTRIRISTLEATSEDPLARAIRQRLRLSHQLTNTGIPVVYSIERTTRGLLPLKEFQEDNPKEFSALENFRVRILPVIAPLPAIMGNAIASHVLCALASQPFTPLTTGPVQSVTARKKLWHFINKSSFTKSSLDATAADLVLDIVYDACSGRSVISGDSGNLCLVPLVFEGDSWNVDQLVLMTTTEAKSHVMTQPFGLSQCVDRLPEIHARIRAELADIVGSI
jgi:tRNA threonylcarbamoyladenosine dehydratase